VLVLLHLDLLLLLLLLLLLALHLLHLLLLLHLLHLLRLLWLRHTLLLLQLLLLVLRLYLLLLLHLLHLLHLLLLLHTLLLLSPIIKAAAVDRSQLGRPLLPQRARGRVHRARVLASIHRHGAARRACCHKHSVLTVAPIHPPCSVGSGLGRRRAARSRHRRGRGAHRFNGQA
jgi:hypothetical protein